MHAFPPAPEKPGSQSKQSFDVPEPITSLPVPGAHSVHTDAPDVLVYLPTAHLVHSVPPGPAKPGAHLTQTSELAEPTTSPPVPAKQSVHDEAPIDALYFPTGQKVHADAPVELYLPTSQTWQGERREPVEFELKVPGGHGEWTS